MAFGRVTATFARNLPTSMFGVRVTSYSEDGYSQFCWNRCLNIKLYVHTLNYMCTSVSMTSRPTKIVFKFWWQAVISLWSSIGFRHSSEMPERNTFGTRIATEKKTQLKLTIWGWTQKFPKLLQKICLKWLYKFSNFSPLQSTRPVILLL